MKIYARWEVTEIHDAWIEVDDNFDPDEADWSDLLAGYEDGESYVATTERGLLEYEVGED
jgi:hypothetical protein